MTSTDTKRLKPGEFYETYKPNKLPPRTARVAILPITVQPDMNQDLDYDRDNELLVELTDSIAAKVQRYPVDLALISNYDLISQKGAPSVYVGSGNGNNAPYGINIPEEERETWEEEDVYPPMVIFLKNSAKNWAAEAATTLESQNADYLLHIWVSFAEYSRADKGLVRRQVYIGTNYARETKFLRDDSKPVEVLQISGLLTDRSGKVVRAGAEGLIYNDTSFWLQVLDVKELITDEMLERVLYTAKRNDLPGDPLALDVALEMLVSQLLDRRL
jgi:hypothetical protein